MRRISASVLFHSLWSAIFFAHRAHYRFKHAPGVADEPYVGLYGFVYLRRVEVYVYYLRVGGESLAVSGSAVAEARAYCDDHVGRHQRAVCDRMPVHSGHAEREAARVGFREGALAEKRRRHGDLVLKRELGQQLRSAGADHAAAGEYHGALRVFYQRDGFIEPRGVVVVFRMIAHEVELRGILVVAHGFLHVGGEVDEHRPRTPRRGDVESFVHRRLYRVDGMKLEAVLHERQARPYHVGLLECVRPDDGLRDLPRYRDERNRVEVRRRYSCEKIRGAGAGCRDADAGPPARARVAVRGVRGRLLVAHQNVV